MGGNATKQWNTERFTKEEYNAVCQYISQILYLKKMRWMIMLLIKLQLN